MSMLPCSRETAILGACAVPEAHPRQQARLAELLRGPVRWDRLIAAVEAENLSGLAWEHLRSFPELPADARRDLMGLRVRQRRLVRFQDETTAELLDVASVERIPVMLLKGSALRRTVYPAAELRAMRDIDVLAPREQCERLYQALARAGFEAHDPHHHGVHLPVLMRRRDGFCVGVEIHWAVNHHWMAQLPELAGRAVPIDVLGRSALAPSPADLLRHVHTHSFRAALWLGAPLVAVADLVAMVERTSDQVWATVDRRMARAVAWLDLLAPLSERGVARVGRVPASAGVGQFYAGWPNLPGSLLRQLGNWRSFAATFAPSPWWLRVRFGAGRGPLALLWAWARHVKNVFEVWW